MSDEVWKGRACSGIPKNVGGSIKRERVKFQRSVCCTATFQDNTYGFFQFLGMML